MYVRTGDDGPGQAPATGTSYLGDFWTSVPERAAKVLTDRTVRLLAEKIRKVMAGGILNNPNITLATDHVSGNVDNANARQNIEDTAKGVDVTRSSYGSAPGGTVKLDIQLLAGILKLAETYKFSISELAGGEHAKGSRHYDGVTVDVNMINGKRVGATHPDVRNFMQQCRDLGATEVLGPGNPGHDTHIHCAWPRP